MRKPTPRVIGIPALLIAVLAAGACTSQPSATPATGAPATGKTSTVLTVDLATPVDIRDQGAAYTVTVSELATGLKSEWGETAEHGQYLRVKIVIVVHEGLVHASDFLFSLQTADGEVYEPTTAALDGPQTLWSADLSAGQRKTAHVAFDAPKQLDRATIYLEDYETYQPIARWHL